jgi:hypothetical protein
VVGAADRNRAHRDAKAVKEKQGAPPEVVDQVAVAVLLVEGRLAQGVKKIAVLWHSAQLQAAAAAPEAVQERRREPK